MRGTPATHQYSNSVLDTHARVLDTRACVLGTHTRVWTTAARILVKNRAVNHQHPPEATYLPRFENGNLPCRVSLQRLPCRVNPHSQNGVNTLLLVGGGPQEGVRYTLHPQPSTQNHKV